MASRCFLLWRRTAEGYFAYPNGECKARYLAIIKREDTPSHSKSAWRWIAVHGSVNLEGRGRTRRAAALACLKAWERLTAVMSLQSQSRKPSRRTSSGERWNSESILTFRD